MIIGETLFAKDSGSTYYSPWFPRQGNRARFTCNYLTGNSVSSLSISVETKSSEEMDADADTAEGGTQTITQTAASDTSWVCWHEDERHRNRPRAQRTCAAQVHNYVQFRNRRVGQDPNAPTAVVHQLARRQGS